MAPPIEGTEIVSVAQAKDLIRKNPESIKEANEKGEIVKEESTHIIDAFLEINENQQKEKESIEKEKKAPEFEKETFRIDSSGSDWHEVTKTDSENPFLKKFINAGKKVKANEAGDVVEYLDGREKGEQLFLDYPVLIRELTTNSGSKYFGRSEEELEKKNIPTAEKLILMAGNPGEPSKKYNTFRESNIQENQLAGHFDPHKEKFYDVADVSYVFTVGGDCAVFEQGGWGLLKGLSGAFGFSGRLLKD